MHDHHRYSDQKLWSVLKQTKAHPAYRAYVRHLTPARVVSGLTLGLWAVGFGVLGGQQVGIASGFWLSSFILSASFGTWLWWQQPVPFPILRTKPTPNQWRIIALLYALGFSTLIGLTVLTMVYRDHLVRGIRQGQIVVAFSSD